MSFFTKENYDNFPCKLCSNSSKEINMNKRVAIITGASKGIGKTISKQMVGEGYFVILVDVDERPGKALEAELTSENTKFYTTDISNEKQVVELFKLVTEEYGRINVLVNNAGIIRDNMIWKMSVEDFDEVIRVNLRGTWLMCREVAKVMRQQESGRIINISSRAWLGNRGQTNYSASKAGVVGLTRSLALELGKYNVSVNAVAPGLIDTPLTQALPDHVKQELIEAQPTKTIGRPEDVANLVVFLSSEKTEFITGQTLYVDGGKSIGSA
jgi:(2S)-[(R)-hydroxy(phenyl)methyl]-succinyl-CoA dehydrogenase BbsD subunit